MEARRLLVAHLDLQLDQTDVNEGTGVAAITATLTRVEAPSLTNSLTVAIAVDDLDELSFPSTVMIPADQTQTTFTFDTINDAVIDGTATVAITASAVGFDPANVSVNVADDDTDTTKIIGGFISGDLPVDSYPVSHTLFIPGGQRLRIAAGTSILFSANQALGVDGSLEITGTEDDPVLLQSSSATPAPGDWTGVRILGNTAQLPTLLDHVVVSHATIGVNIRGNRAPVTISDSDIGNSSQSGIFVGDDSGREVQVVNNRIHDNGTHGVHMSASAGGCNSAVVSIAVNGNEIDTNVESGVHMTASASSGCLIGPGGATAGPLIANNRIHNNLRGITGIAFNSSNRTGSLSAEIQNNYIHDQISDGIRLEEGSRGSRFVPKVRHNTIVNNGGDGVFHISNVDSGFELFNNTIHNNMRGIATDVGHTPLPDGVGFNNLSGNSGGDWVNYPASFGVPSTVNLNGTPADANQNISADPLFLPDGLHIQLDSPNVGAGTPDVTVPGTDVDGDERIAFVDIGADEVSKLIVSFTPEGTQEFSSTLLSGTFQLREDAAISSVGATIRRNSVDKSGQQAFAIVNPDPTTLLLPAGGVIPAGADSVTLAVNTIDDGIVEFDQDLVLRTDSATTASVGGFLRIVDDDVLPIQSIDSAESPLNTALAGNSDREVDVTWLTNSQYVATWVTTPTTGSPEIVARLFDPDAQPLGPQFTIATLPSTSTFQFSRVDAAADGSFVVAWTQDDDPDSVFSQRFDVGGSALTSVIELRLPGEINDQQLDDISVAPDGSWAIAYNETFPVNRRSTLIRRYSPTGTLLGNRELLIEQSANIVYSPAAMDTDSAGNILAVWPNPGIRGKRFDAANGTWEPGFQVSSLGNRRPSVSFSESGDFVVAYGRTSSISGLYARTFRSDATPILEDSIFVTTDPGAIGTSAVTTTDAGDFLVSWQSGGEVSAREFHQNGVPAAAELLLSTTIGVKNGTPRQSLSPDGASIVAAWTGDGPGDTSGVFARQLAVSFPSLSLNVSTTTVPESAGRFAVLIRREGVKTDFPVTVTISSADPSLVSVPQTRVIPAGSNSAGINITVTDNELASGDQNVVVTLTSGALSAPEALTVTDDETPMLTLSFAGAASEEGTTATGTVTRNTPTDSDLVVQLRSQTPSQATVPFTVTIPAGADSADFDVTAVDDGIVDGTQTVEIVGSALAHEPGVAEVEVLDIPALIVTLPDMVAENAGTVSVTVERTTGTANSLVVDLESSNVDLIPEIGEVTIPAGESSVEINAIVTDDSLVGADTSVTIQASASGFLTGSDDVIVEDDDVPQFTLSFGQQSIDENGGSTSVTVTRNAGISLEVVAAIVADPALADVDSSITFATGEPTAVFDVSSIDNDVAHGDRDLAITVQASGFESATGTITLLDDETASLTLSLSDPSITESEETTLRLERNTINPITVDLSSSDTAGVSLPAQVVFAENEQSTEVIVSSIDNPTAEGDRTVTLTAMGDGLPTGMVDLTITDDDVASIVATADSLPLVINEAGASADFEVTLGAQPVSNVVLTITESDTSQFAASSNALVFSPNDWDQPKTVTLSAIDDDLVEPTLELSVTVSVSPGESAEAFGSVDPQSLAVQLDDDDPAGIIIDETNGSTFVSETGIFDQFSLRLQGAPLSDVTLLPSAIDVPGISFVPDSVTFNGDNWNAPQQIDIITNLGFDADRTTIGDIAILISDNTTAFGFASLSEPIIDLLLVDKSDADLRLTDSTESVVFLDAVSGAVLGDLGAVPIGRFVTGIFDESITVDFEGAVADGFVLDLNSGDDTVLLETDPLTSIDGGDGFDRLAVTGPGITLDLTGPDALELTSVEQIDLQTSQPQTLILDPESVAEIVGSGGSLLVTAGEADTVELGVGWQADPPRADATGAFHQLVADDVLLELSNERPWTNPLLAPDVDRSGDVTALDALRIINRLARQGDVQELPPPSETQPVEDYYDVSKDGNATALDALQVINFLGRGDSPAGSEGLQVSTPVETDLSAVSRVEVHDGPSQIAEHSKPVVATSAVPREQRLRRVATAETPSRSTQAGSDALRLLDATLADWQG